MQTRNEPYSEHVDCWDRYVRKTVYLFINNFNFHNVYYGTSDDVPLDTELIYYYKRGVVSSKLNAFDRAVMRELNKSILAAFDKFVKTQ